MSRQKLGQHFLVKGAILERIARAACPEGAPLVLEIGPGRGALTGKLLKRADRVIALELDPYMVDYLRTRFDERLTVVHADALEAEWPDGPIAGNLPYYAATPIIERTVRQGREAVYLIQKEVALRLAAQPGSRDYGFLTVRTQIFATVEYLFDVKPGAFQPPPKVDSAVVRLSPRTPPAGDIEPFLRFVAQAFHQKRKTLRNNLAGTYRKERIDTLPEGSLRAEQISIPQFLEIYHRLTGTPH